MNSTTILTHEAISLKLDRIAWQILEEHVGQKELVLVGLADRGTDVAQKIKTRIESFSDTEATLLTLSLNKKAPLSSPISIENGASINESSVILVDDVLNSGITMAAALKEILNHNPSSVKTAVLANRDHHKFPIQANYVGISLATTLKEHIFYKEENGAMLITLS